MNSMSRESVGDKAKDLVIWIEKGLFGTTSMILLVIPVQKDLNRRPDSQNKALKNQYSRSPTLECN